MLLEKDYYDPDDEMDRHMLAFVFIPVIQKEMDTSFYTKFVMCKLWRLWERSEGYTKV